LLLFSLLAEQLAVVPEQIKLQVQDQGPEPVTEEAVPVLQRLADGAELTVVPSSEPQAPFAEAVLFELQLALGKPLTLHVHVQGPRPETDEEVPELQRLVVGFMQVDPPSAEPQAGGQAGIVQVFKIVSGLGNGQKLSSTVFAVVSLHSMVLD
jgi:hypothetical protein